MSKSVVGIFRSREEVEALISKLQAVGVPADEISVLLPNASASAAIGHEASSKAPEGAIAGVAAGGAIGGALGILAGIGMIAVPGIGPFIAAGPIMAALSGAAVAGGVGGIVGSLVGMGIPEYEARVYESSVRAGHILVTAHTEGVSERRLALELFASAGAVAVAARSERHDVTRA